MGTTSGIEWIYSQRTGKWEIIKNKSAEDVSLPPSTPLSSQARSGGGGSGGGGGGDGSGNGNLVGKSDEPLLPPFPNGNDPHASSSSSDSSNNPRRGWGLGRLPPLPPGGSTINSGCVPGYSPCRRYEMKMGQMNLPKCPKEMHQMISKVVPLSQKLHGVASYRLQGWYPYDHIDWMCNGWKSRNLVRYKSWVFETILQGGRMEPICHCNGREIPRQTRRKESPRQNEWTQAQGRHWELPNGHGNPQLQGLPSWHLLEDLA